MYGGGTDLELHVPILSYLNHTSIIILSIVCRMGGVVCCTVLFVLLG